jgi:NADH:ubiquinone oxidoreductase subunit K
MSLLFYLAVTAVVLLMISGLYSLLMTRNLIRVLISIEILMKSVTMLIIIIGYEINRISTAQAMVITLTIIEVVAVAAGSGIAVGLFKHYNTLDMDRIRVLKRQGD